ncbi:MAG: Metal-binding GTPase YjiA [uncultured Caballeronia sp.]|nr:MAG: Metal-binding GTPase YjiA [uncultured Caballeronia sp.]
MSMATRSPPCTPRRQDQVVCIPQRPRLRSQPVRRFPRRHPADLRRTPAALQGRAVYDMKGVDRKVVFQGVHQMMGSDLAAK